LHSHFWGKRESEGGEVKFFFFFFAVEDEWEGGEGPLSLSADYFIHALFSTSFLSVHSG